MIKASWLTKPRRLLLVSLVNLLLVGFEIYALVLSAMDQAETLFEFYTIDSNILCLASSFLFLAFAFLAWKKKTYEFPRFVEVLRLMSSTGLALTFLVVVLILCPIGGPSAWEGMLLEGNMLFHHLICPLLSCLSFLLLETNEKIKLKDTAYPLVFTLIYAIPMLILNITRTIEGPYLFLEVYNQPWYMSIIYFIGLFAFDYLLLFSFSFPRLSPTRKKSNLRPQLYSLYIVIKAR